MTGTRKGELVEMKQNSGKTRIVAHVPSRGLIGYHVILTDTRAQAL
jgi:GTP-binding protein